MHIIKEIVLDNGNKIKIVPDDDPMSPREWDNLGEILYTSTRYTLGDKCVQADEITEIAHDPNNIVLPVFAYIHSGIVLSTGPFSCIFDSGQCGIIWVSKEKVREEWKVKRISKKLMNTVLEGLKSEVEQYSRYLGGEYVGYLIEDSEGNHIDSCFGFSDVNDAVDEAKANANAIAKQAS